MRFGLSCSGVFLGLLMASPAVPASDGSATPLGEFLAGLRDQGIRVIFSSDLVTDEMLLQEVPGDATSAEALSRILAPFGLKAMEGSTGILLVVRSDEPTDAGSTAAEQHDEVPIPEIVVTSSLHSLQYSPSGTQTYLDRAMTARIPAAAEEAVRLTNRLPGTANGGISARNHVRGGEVNEVLFMFDGLRLYEPYHLKDFQSVATIVNSHAVGGIEFYTGAYPAQYGDRMSGVMDITLREPEKPMETELALSFFNTSLLSIGNFGGGDRGDWLLTARRGNLDLIADLVDPDIGSPDYRDYLAHVGWDFGPRATVSANYLASIDKLALFDEGRGEAANARYSNQVSWLKWDAEWSDQLKSLTVFAYSDIENRRLGTLDLPGIVSGDLSSTTSFKAFELRQHWTWTPAQHWMLQAGVNAKHLDAHYQLAASKQIAAPFDTILGNQPLTVLDFDRSPEGAQYAAYAEFRWRPVSRLTLDLGLRWDQQTYTTAADDRQYSPRASLLWEPSRSTQIRLGWGQYYQAQEINELQLTDGVDEFFPAQRAEHFVLNAKHWFSDEVDLALSVYRKSFRTIRPRFENVFNTLTLLPELQFDRVLIDASTAEALGAELILTRGASDEDLLWWLSYSWSRVEDSTGEGNVPRSWDQSHTLKGGVSLRWRQWDFSLAGEVHTGWPRTELYSELLSQPDGSTSLSVSTSRRNAFRHALSHSLDMRISRDFDLSRGTLTAFLEVTNLYNQENACCMEYSLAPDGSVAANETHWLPLVPSLGIVWRF